jgi:hypothetical protein
MIAINSDIEFTTWEAQLDLLRLFAERGLETAFSYWCFNDPAMTWRMFEQDLTPSPQAPVAFALARAGVFDTLHSFGGVMNGRGCTFDRNQMGSALRRLSDEGIRTRVYSNHGTIRDTQNVGGPWMGPPTPEPNYLNYHKGDLPGSPRYHLDLTLAYGVRFFWVDVDRARAVKTFTVRSADEPNSLFISQTSRDGNPILRFRRTDADVDPDAINFGQQIDRVLDDAAEGYSIIYTHLGVARDDNGKPIQNPPPYLDHRGFEALDRLRESQSAGETLVSTTSRLLTHALVSAARPWTIVNRRNAIHIDFQDRFSLLGVDFKLEWSDLEGFALELPEAMAATATLNGTSRPLDRWSRDNRSYAGFRWKPIDLGEALEEAQRNAQLRLQ